jgi:hypothetical protein
MILVQPEDETISGYTDENPFPKLESLSKQFLVTNMENVESASDRNCSIPKPRLRQTETPQVSTINEILA